MMYNTIYESKRETFGMSINQEFLVKLNGSHFLNGTIPFNNMGDAARTWIAIAYSLLSLLGTLSNLLVVICIASNRGMRTIFKLLLLNLSVADMIVTGIVVPILGSWQSLYYPIWQYSSIMCKMVNVGSHVGGLASSSTLAVIAIYRFALVKYSKRFKVGYKHLLITVVLIWTVAFTGSVGSVFKAKVVSMVIKGKSQKLCLMVHKTHSAERQELIFRVAMYVLSSTFMLVLYTNMILFLKRHRIPGLLTVDGQCHAAEKRKRQAAYMMAVATVVMIICFLPYMTLVIINIIAVEGFYSSVQGIEILTNIIVAFNSAINPFIYWSFCSETKMYIKQMVSSCYDSTIGSTKRTKWFVGRPTQLESTSQD